MQHASDRGTHLMRYGPRRSRWEPTAEGWRMTGTGPRKTLRSIASAGISQHERDSSYYCTLGSLIYSAILLRRTAERSDHDMPRGKNSWSPGFPFGRCSIFNVCFPVFLPSPSSCVEERPHPPPERRYAHVESSKKPASKFCPLS